MRAEGFSCSLDFLYGGLGISKLKFLIKKRKKKNLSCIFYLQFSVIKTLDPYLDPDPESLEMLVTNQYPDPDSMNLDPQLCCHQFNAVF